MLTVAVLFYLHPQDLLSFTLPPPQSIRVAVERIGEAGQVEVAVRTVHGAAATTVYDAVRSLRAEPISPGTGCHEHAQGRLVYLLTFRYASRPAQVLVQNPCGEWIVGSRIWKPSASLVAALGRLVPKRDH